MIAVFKSGMGNMPRASTASDTGTPIRARTTRRRLDPEGLFGLLKNPFFEMPQHSFDTEKTNRIVAMLPTPVSPETQADLMLDAAERSG